MSGPPDAVAVLSGALRGLYRFEFRKAGEDDWRSDAEFLLARFQEYGVELRAVGESSEDVPPLDDAMYECCITPPPFEHADHVLAGLRRNGWDIVPKRDR